MDKSLNQSQIIIKNKKGVYVLTPTLNQMFKFQSSIIESLENFKRRVDLAIQDYQTLDFGSLDSEFKINLQIDNGIDKMALAGNLVGAGVLTYSAIMFSNSWNPVGWTMFAIGAVTVLIGVYKSFKKWLSDDYKKSEQKQSTNDNLDKIVENIKPKIMQKINPISIDFSKMVNKIIYELEDIVKQRKLINQDIKNILKELEEVSIIIKEEGEK